MVRSALLVLLLLVSAAHVKADDAADLIAAAQNGDVSAVRRLLDKGVDVNTRSAYQATALSFAAEKGHVEIVRVLLERGADVTVRDTFYHASPLTWAVMRNKPDVATLLIAHGAPEGAEVLPLAVSQGRLDLVKVIIEKAQPRQEALDSAWALATQSGKSDIAELLTKAGAKPSTTTQVAVSESTLQQYAGTYKNTQIGMQITFRAVDGRLKGVVAGQPEITYAPSDATTFNSVEFPGIVFVFQPAADKCDRVTLKQSGVTLEFERLQPPAPGEAADADAAPIGDVPEPTERVSAPASWPQFRGPSASGVADGQYPPTRWNASKEQNVAWRAKLPGLAHASPIVWDDRVFALSAVTDTGESALRHGLYGDFDYARDFDQPHRWMVYCLKRDTGEILWEQSAHEGKPVVKRHTKATHANSTPATDGRHVVAVVGSQYLCCYDVSGKLLWKNDLGVLDAGWFYDAEYQWGFGSSPIIYRDRVILQCDVQRAPFIAAWDLKSGNLAWKTPRDEVCSWATPNVFEREGAAELVCNGTRAIRGYDPSDGKERWRLTGNSEVCVPTPILANGLIVITAGYNPIQPIYAIRPGATGDISLATDADNNAFVAWSKKRGGIYMQTPLAYRDRLYACRDNGVLTCYRAATGEKLFDHRLGGGGSFTASAVAADGRIYFTSEDGDVYVIRDGDTFEQLAKNELGDVCMATPAISNGMIFFRTSHQVIALRRPG